jgi:septum formation protein
MAGPATSVQRGRLILASASAGRRELLARLGRPFEVVPADVEEPTGGFAGPRSFVHAASWLKASVVAPKVDAGIVIAADTIGWINGHAVLKPNDEDDARRILRELAGNDHELWTGVVLWRRPDDLQVLWQEHSLVHFAPLDDAVLDRYLASRSWRGHSGAYAILEKDDPFVRVVEGSVSNVIGLPMESLAHRLDWLEASGAA